MFRWTYGYSPIHGAGYCLDPEYVNHDQQTNSEVWNGGFVAVVRRLCSRNEESIATILEQYVQFKTKTGVFAEPYVWNLAKKLSGAQWWQTCGGQVQELRMVAMKVLSQVTSQSLAETSWSEYDYVHDRRRNRLSNARANKLVHLHANTRLIKQRESSSFRYALSGWDRDDSSESECESETEVRTSAPQRTGIVDTTAV